MPKNKRTEREMLTLLRAKFGAEAGNGPAYAFVDHVRNDAGFSATRTIDAVSMSLWPSRGLVLAAYEIKCSRNDWLTELKAPSKAEAFQPYMDQFWLVVSDAEFVKPGELPETWGLIVPKGTGLGVIKDAPRNQNVKPLDRGMLAALLRQAGVAAASQPEIDAAERRGYERGRESVAQDRRHDASIAERQLERYRQWEEEIVQAIGRDDLAAIFRGRSANFAAAVKAALDGQRDLEHLRARIQRLGADARVLGEQTERILNEHFEEVADAA
jgi:hypothetical protein